MTRSSTRPCHTGLAERKSDAGSLRAGIAVRRLLEAGLAPASRWLTIACHPTHGEILAYEIDGYGSRILMDDANIPSLLALPYLGYCPKDDPLYRRTRAFILSPDNPYFSRGNAGRGVGGPHVGPGWIWPLSMIIQALTSDCDEEIRDCLGQLKQTHAGTGFIHESFWQDDAAKFTRSWFAWANTLFGELILTLHRQHPHRLQ